MSPKSSNPKKKGGRNRRAHDQAKKAAVLAALLAGQGVDAVARDYKLPIGTVKGWKSKQVNGETLATVTPTQQADIGALLERYLAEALTTLQFQHRTIFRNLPWLKKQSAAELGTLHGIIADKAVRLLEGMHLAKQAETEQPAS